MSRTRACRPEPVRWNMLRAALGIDHLSRIIPEDSSALQIIISYFDRHVLERASPGCLAKRAPLRQHDVIALSQQEPLHRRINQSLPPLLPRLPSSNPVRSTENPLLLPTARIGNGTVVDGKPRGAKHFQSGRERFIAISREHLLNPRQARTRASCVDRSSSVQPCLDGRCTDMQTWM